MLPARPLPPRGAHRGRLAALLAAVLLLGPISPAATRPVLAREVEPPPHYLSWSRPGPFRAPYQQQFAVRSFAADQRIVATYFFYWFDAATLRDSRARRGFDPMAFHPPDLDTISFRDPDWYERQFRDMLDAGIDVVLPDYWGEPGQYPHRVAPAPELNYFATQGVPPMVEALDRLDGGGTPLKIGMFFDTTILNDE